MALTYPQRGFAGAAVAGTIAAPGLTSVNGAGVTFTSSTTLTGWTEIANGSWSGDNICVTFGYGTASEEKILCTFNSSTSTFTIVTRGYDGTSAVAHTTGSLFILTSTATEAAELNAVTQSMKGLLLTDGSAPLPADISTSAAARGTSTKPASANHTHLLSTITLNGWLSSSASGATEPAGKVLTSNGAGGTTWVDPTNVFSGSTSYTLTGFAYYLVIADVTLSQPTTGMTLGAITLTVGSKVVSQSYPATSSWAQYVTTSFVTSTSGTITATATKNAGASGTLGTINLTVIGFN